jgi:hypothetical protein
MTESAKVFDNLSNVPNWGQTPLNESHVRPLTRLSPQLQIEAWTKTVETAPDGKITARHVSKIVKETIGYEYKERVERTKREVKDENRMSEEANRIFKELVELVQNETHEGWVRTSRDRLVHALNSIIALIQHQEKNGGRNV